VSTNDHYGTIVGSLSADDRTRPFVFFPAEDRILLDAYEPQARLAALDDVDAAALEARILALANAAGGRVRLGEYYCYVCHRWVPSTRDQWSVGICLSCSLDRGSELADYYRRRN
jgi:hypothetical protein